MRTLPKSLAICFVLVIFLFPAQVKSQDPVARPKIGLALSGGGAKGLAHLGVIKVMEEAGLRNVRYEIVAGGIIALHHAVV